MKTFSHYRELAFVTTSRTSSVLNHVVAKEEEGCHTTQQLLWRRAVGRLNKWIR